MRFSLRISTEVSSCLIRCRNGHKTKQSTEKAFPLWRALTEHDTTIAALFSTLGASTKQIMTLTAMWRGNAQLQDKLHFGLVHRTFDHLQAGAFAG
ncbi:hypothetical protein GPALN_003293 [Globodera pallida]|nr:hypothetical protein GPALN_003293 [Globodera pallida]